MTQNGLTHSCCWLCSRLLISTCKYFLISSGWKYSSITGDPYQTSDSVQGTSDFNLSWWLAYRIAPENSLAPFKSRVNSLNKYRLAKLLVTVVTEKRTIQFARQSENLSNNSTRDNLCCVGKWVQKLFRNYDCFSASKHFRVLRYYATQIRLLHVSETKQNLQQNEIATAVWEKKKRFRCRSLNMWSYQNTRT